MRKGGKKTVQKTKKISQKARQMELLTKVLFVALILMLGTVIYAVVSAKKESNRVYDNLNAGGINIALLSLVESELPEGWTAETNDSSHIRLIHANGCFVDVLRAANTGESDLSALEHGRLTVEELVAQGYTVSEEAGVIKVKTMDGEKEVEAQVLGLSGLEEPAFEKYAYITDDSTLTQVQVSCVNQADLAGAEAALLAVVIN